MLKANPSPKGNGFAFNLFGGGEGRGCAAARKLGGAPRFGRLKTVHRTVFLTPPALSGFNSLVISRKIKKEPQEAHSVRKRLLFLHIKNDTFKFESVIVGYAF